MEKLQVEPGEILIVDDVEKIIRIAEEIGLKSVKYEKTDQVVKEIQSLVN